MLSARFDITAHNSPSILPMLLVRLQFLELGDNAKERVPREGEEGSKPDSSPPCLIFRDR